MKRWLISFVAMVSLLSLLAGCGGSAGSGGSGGDSEIRIAYIGPLSGDGAPWGSVEANAMKLLVEEYNAKGGMAGKQIKLFTYDNRMDNVETTNAARKAIEADKVHAIICCNASGNSIALSTVAEQAKIPFIATTSTNPKVTVADGKVRPYAFRVAFTDPFQGTVAASYAVKEMKAKTAAVLYEVGSDYSVGLAEFFQESFKKQGGKIVAVEGYKTGDVDFRAQLSKIKDANADIIFFPALYKEIALGTTQARQLGIKATFLGGDTWLNGDIFTLSPESIQGAVFVAPLSNDDPVFKDFKARYKAKFNAEPGAEGGNAFFTHDALLVLEDAVKRAGSLDGQKLRDAIEATKDIKGLTGTITISPQDHNPAGKDAVILKIEGKVPKFVTRFKP